MCYLCKDCGAYVGCHNNTQIPLGTLANKELRQLRIKAHNKIDKLWQNHTHTRDEVYQYLNKIFGREIHIGQSGPEICKKIIKLKIDYSQKIKTNI